MTDYQSIRGKSSSDSVGKLQSLRLPKLTGKNFLDLGCNEGFFCGVALAAGAARAVGVDIHEPNIAKARDYFPGAEFIASDWMSYLDKYADKFDLILFSSAIHYAPDQELILTRVLDHLTVDGTLVLECGLGQATESGQKFISYDRWDGKKFYFTTEYIQIFVQSQGFDVFLHAPSVQQAGDAISRFVLHIRRRQRCIILNLDPPDSGKSYLGKLLGREVRRRELDLLAESIIRTTDNPVLRVFDASNIAKFWEAVVHLGQTDWAAEQIVGFVNDVPPVINVVYAEGSLPTELAAAVNEKLADAQAIVFAVSLSSGKLHPKEPGFVKCLFDEDGVRFIHPLESDRVERLDLLQRKVPLLYVQATLGKEVDTDDILLYLNSARVEGKVVGRKDQTISAVFVLSQPIERALIRGEKPAFMLPGPNRAYYELRCDTETKPALPREQGRVDEERAGLLRGWACDFVSPGNRFEVVLYLNGEEVARTLADKSRGDLLKSGLENRNCGFEFRLPKGLTGREIVNVCVAGQDAIVLSNNRRPIADYAAKEGTENFLAPIREQGRVDEEDAGLLRGWAHDFASPNRRLEVILYLDNKEIARTLANKHRADLLNAGLGDGNCAFEFKLPEDLTGRELVNVRVAEEDTIALSNNRRPLADYAVRR